MTMMSETNMIRFGFVQKPVIINTPERVISKKVTNITVTETHVERLFCDVAEMLEVRVGDIKSEQRFNKLSVGRTIICYILTQKGMTEKICSSLFNRSDHSFANYHKKKMEYMVENSPLFFDPIDRKAIKFVRNYMKEN